MSGGAPCAKAINPGMVPGNIVAVPAPAQNRSWIMDPEFQKLQIRAVNKNMRLHARVTYIYRTPEAIGELPQPTTSEPREKEKEKKNGEEVFFPLRSHFSASRNCFIPDT